LGVVVVVVIKHKELKQSDKAVAQRKKGWHTQAKSLIVGSDKKSSRARLILQAGCIWQVWKGQSFGSHSRNHWNLYQWWPFSRIGNWASWFKIWVELLRLLILQLLQIGVHHRE